MLLGQDSSERPGHWRQFVVPLASAAGGPRLSNRGMEAVAVDRAKVGSAIEADQQERAEWTPLGSLLYSLRRRGSLPRT